MSHPKIDYTSLRDRTAPLDDGRAAALRASVLARHARHKARVRIARVAAPALAAMALVLGLWLQHRGHAGAPSVASNLPSASVAPSANAAPPASVAIAPGGGSFGGLVMADGSRVTFLVAATELVQSGARGRQSSLVKGAARFDVVHDASAPFRVTAGGVVIEDIGTVFAVRLADDGAVTVSVESGSVSVRGAHGERTLEAGASQIFGASTPSAFAPASAPSAAAPPPPSSSAWRKPALSGDYDRAYTMIQSPGATVRNDPEELLLAADAARLTGHPAGAVPFLRRLVARFPSDSRAGLAAFTLGRVLLDDLGQPREAAASFQTAYAHGGPLAEDALAREAEAWTAAGDRVAARNAARRYLVAYPHGARVAALRRLADEP